MPWIKIKQTYAGPEGLFLNGETRDVDAATLRRLADKLRFERAQCPYMPRRKQATHARDKQVLPARHGMADKSAGEM